MFQHTNLQCILDLAFVSFKVNADESPGYCGEVS
jgi:hypothetical protein